MHGLKIAALTTWVIFVGTASVGSFVQTGQAETLKEDKITVDKMTSTCKQPARRYLILAEGHYSTALNYSADTTIMQEKSVLGLLAIMLYNAGSALEQTSKTKPAK